MGDEPINEGVSQTIELATGYNTETATFFNVNGTVGW